MTKSDRAYIIYMAIRLLEMRRIPEIHGINLSALRPHNEPLSQSSQWMQFMDVGILETKSYGDEQGLITLWINLAQSMTMIFILRDVRRIQAQELYSLHILKAMLIAILQENRSAWTYIGLIQSTDPEARNGESGKPWRGYNPTSVGRHWAVPSKLVLAFGIDPKLPQHEKLDALYNLGLIDLPKRFRGIPSNL